MYLREVTYSRPESQGSFRRPVETSNAPCLLTMLYNNGLTVKGLQQRQAFQNFIGFSDSATNRLRTPPQSIPFIGG